MADVFISYAREEAARADDVRRALEGLGLTVFHDVERLDAGDVWSDVIDRELKTAGAVVALWSPHALSRPWVKKEYAVAQGRGVLVPAILEQVTDLDIPTQFSDLQRVDLSDFHGQPDHTGWRKLVRALAKVMKRKDLLAAQIEALAEEKQTAKVKAELEAARKELQKLRKLKGGVKPVFLGIVVALLVAIGGAATWSGMSVAATRAQQEASEASLKRELESISNADLANATSTKLLDRVLQKTTFEDLLRLGKVNSNAAYLIARAYGEGKGGTKQDIIEHRRYLETACDLGNMRGCSDLANLHSSGEVEHRNLERAIELFAKACQTSPPIGCTNLGVMYEQGRGLAQNFSKAAELWQAACDAGEPVACRNVGNLHARGVGVPYNENTAVSMYQLACQGKDGYACSVLGDMHVEGRIVTKDETRAATYFKMACDQGIQSACR